MTNFLNLLRKIKSFVKRQIDQHKKQKLFEQELAQFTALLKTPIPITQNPCLTDNTGITGIEPHYTYHPAWAARVLAQTKPAKHVDISSITHFSNIVSAFIPTEFYDYRPANIILSNYSSGRADLTNLHFPSNSVESLSCMHTVEHIGLGRYGDPMDVDGDKKAMIELARVLAPDGNLLFVVPIGDARIEFNAHRVYAYQTIIDNFSGLTLKEFSLIPDDFGQIGYITNPTIDIINKQHWGCGCFLFTKK
jgi:SAM-dependent methyltransferase